MTTATICVAELQARVFDLDAALVRARREVERDRAAVFLGFYHCIARHRLTKFETELGIQMVNLSDVQMREMSELLLKPLIALQPKVAAAKSRRGHLRKHERWCFDAFCSMLDETEQLALRLAAEAAKDNRPGTIEYPALDARVRHDAMMASALLPPVRRDSAEADPDPDYGF